MPWNRIWKTPVFTAVRKAGNETPGKSAVPSEKKYNDFIPDGRRHECQVCERDATCAAG